MDSGPDLLGHIIAECVNIETWTKGLTYDQFIDDPKTHYAVARAYENIGEASGKILQIALEFSEQYKNVPFRNYNGMRNILAHQYYKVDLEVIWGSVQKVGQLKRDVSAIETSL